MSILNITKICGGPWTSNISNVWWFQTWFIFSNHRNGRMIATDSYSPPARWGLLDFMSVASSSSSSSPSSSSSSSSSSNCDPRSTVFSVGPQPRPSMLSVPCRTSTTTIHVSVPCRTSTMTIHAQCSLPDLNHDHPRPVFPAGPQPRPSTPSVPCRTSTTTIHAQCSLPDLNREYPRQKICHIECQKICQIEC